MYGLIGPPSARPRLGLNYDFPIVRYFLILCRHVWLTVCTVSDGYRDPYCQRSIAVLLLGGIRHRDRDRSREFNQLSPETSGHVPHCLRPAILGDLAPWVTPNVARWLKLPQTGYSPDPTRAERAAPGKMNTALQ
jgi:hypothetical protein